MSGADELVSIGEVARLAGCATSALRYYESRGLIAPTTRRSGRRLYKLSAVDRVGLVRLCQDAGFTLAEIGKLGSAADRASWTGLVERKVTDLDAHIARAREARQLLVHALECPEPDVRECPRFQEAVRARTLQ